MAATPAAGPSHAPEPPAAPEPAPAPAPEPPRVRDAVAPGPEEPSGTAAGTDPAEQVQVVPGASPHAGTRPPVRGRAISRSDSERGRVTITLWTAVVVAGIVALALAALHVGPVWLDGAGAIAVLTCFTWTLMARAGGHPWVYAILALGVGLVAELLGGQELRSGAAVMTCVVSGVLAVVLTVPSQSVVGAVREVVVAVAVASVGAFATVGFEPTANSVRFAYITLALGLVVIFVLVWRFGAGLHGLGTRGVVILLTGTVGLAVSLAYGELLRRYGSEAAIGPVTQAALWSRDTLGATPRPMMILLGVPALLWGVHMRARRRQGWWVCAFGASATLVVAQRLVSSDISYVEAGLQVGYSVALGMVVGFLLIRLDLRLTGQRGRRARAAEEVHAQRPEPRRFAAL